MNKETVSKTVTREQVATAAGVHPTTISRWLHLGLLPAPTYLNLGKRGRTSRWPARAAAQARWVKSQLDAGRPVDDVAAAVRRGEHLRDIEVERR
jgi:hypothetical protein